VRLVSVRDFVFGSVAGLLVGLLIGVVGLFFVRSGDEPDLEPGGLTILSGRDESAGGQRQQLIDIWNDSHPHNQAKIVVIDQAASGVYSEMIAQARNPDIDVFNLDVTLTAAFADPASGDPWIRQIDESWLAEPPAKAFMAKPLSTCFYQGRLWALPFNTDAGLLYYRTGLGAEPPFDWAKIKATAARHHEFPAAYTAQLGDYEGLTVNVLEAVWAGSGDLSIARDGQVTLDLDAWNKAVRLLVPARDGRAGLVHPDALQSEETGSTSTFQNGSVPFMRNWPVAYRTLKNADKKVPFDVTALPGPSVLGGQNLAVSARTGKPRAAQALIEFLTNQRSQNILFDRGGFAATRAGVYADETIKADHPYAPLLHTAIDNARLRPVSPNYVAFSETLSRQIYAVLDGEQDALPDDFADSLTAALRGK
jgi:ABC-type glycerol-3-phosphate transport system substrate-binding protein